MSHSDFTPDETKREERQALLYSKLTRIGVALAVLCLGTILCVQLFGRLLHSEAARNRAVFALGGIGAVLLLTQILTYFRKTNAHKILLFYRDPHFWGLVTSLTAIATYIALPLIHPLQKPELIVMAAPAPAPAPLPEPAPAPLPEPQSEPEPIKPPSFPELQVRGVVLNGSRSCAVIDGKTVMIGEPVGEGTLATVSEGLITIDIRGFKKEYSAR